MPDRGPDPEVADLVALLRAHLAGDGPTVERILAMVDGYALFAIMVGQHCELLVRVAGSVEAADATLADWQRRRPDLNSE